MESESKSINHQELKESVCAYVKYCVTKQVPPPPSYSSDIYKEKIINEQYKSIIELIFNSEKPVYLNKEKSVNLISHLSLLYLNEISVNKDYESRETIVTKSEFENFLWYYVNDHFKFFTAEILYPIPKHVIEAQKRKDAILNPIYNVLGFGFLLFWIWIIYGWIFN